MSSRKWNKWENHDETHDLPQREIMHKTTKRDSTEVKDKENNLLTMAYFPDFTGFIQRTVIQEATLHSVWRPIKIRILQKVEVHACPRRQEESGQTDCLLAREVAGKKDPWRTSSNIQRFMGHGTKGERRRFVVDSNHCSAPKPWGIKIIHPRTGSH